MNIDHTGGNADLRANVCGRVASIGGSARRFGMACVLACSAFTAFGAVHAQDRNGFRKDDLQFQRDERRQEQRQDQPRFEQRDQRADDAHRQQQERSAEAQRRSGRMTPDERRDLRRQINEAGVDLYPNTPRR
jgi:hypothetical protein